MRPDAGGELSLSRPEAGLVRGCIGWERPWQWQTAAKTEG